MLFGPQSARNNSSIINYFNTSLEYSQNSTQTSKYLYEIWVVYNEICTDKPSSNKYKDGDGAR